MFTKRTLPAMLFVWATAGSAYANVVVDMSQVQDYTKYQTDLQQCEGLAVQNQPTIHSSVVKIWFRFKILLTMSATRI